MITTQPFGAAIIVRRVSDRGVPKFLILHRHTVPDDGDDCSIESNQRRPMARRDDIVVTARRELSEETGLDRCPTLIANSETTWLKFAVRVDPEANITPLDEHGRLDWLHPTAALG